MIAFQPTGPLKSFIAATPTPPAAVQATSLDGTNAQQYLLTNIDATNDATVGWGSTAADAASNAAAGTNTSNCYYLLRGTQIVVTAAQNAFFTGISSAATATVKVQAGHGN